MIHGSDGAKKQARQCTTTIGQSVADLQALIYFWAGCGNRSCRFANNEARYVHVTLKGKGVSRGHAVFPGKWGQSMPKNFSKVVRLAILAGGLALMQTPANAEDPIYDLGSGGGTITLSTQSTPSTPPASVVPEPATWIMMIAGFGLVGWQLQRRGRTTGREAMVPA